MHITWLETLNIQLFLYAVALALDDFPHPWDELLYSLLEPAPRRFPEVGKNRFMDVVVVRDPQILF